MDFINQRNRKLNIHPDGHFEFINHISKVSSNEIEQLSKDIYRSIKMRNLIIQVTKTIIKYHLKK